MLYIFLALIFYTGAVMFAAFATRHLNSNIVTAIVNTFSAIIPFLIIIPVLSRKALENGKAGLIAAILGGVCIALFALALNKSFQTNKVAFVTPVVFGGMIFFSAFLSYIFFKEKLTVLHMSGLALLGVGLLMIIYAAYSGK